MSRVSLLLYFGGVFVVLLATTTGLILAARATKWKPKPVRPLWGALTVCGAVLVPGTVCSIAARDIHILYWWLIGLPVSAILLPLIFVSTTLCVRLINITFFSILDRFRSKR